ncbi:MAG TPA: response regulator [Cyanobacteria bacterium UBA11370]|nr:response regulator [Cyanobacteria bacterium UBA11370]HBY77989.1 response regulator [Cyanobacteria bacterium UBA11148]
MKKILLIEPNEVIRSTLVELMTLEGFEIVATENGQIGLQLATELTPDLIISDINLPCLNGCEILKYLRANFLTANIPFIFLTAESRGRKRYHALELGANDYLIKPVEYEKLLEAIATQLSNN